MAPHDKLAHQARHYILSHLDQKLDRKKLVEVLGYSLSHCNRIMLESLGMTLHNYVTHVRMEQAKILLQNRHLTIQQVGEQIGYHYPAHFGAVFRKIEGMTPGEYRKSLETPIEIETGLVSVE